MDAIRLFRSLLDRDLPRWRDSVPVLRTRLRELRARYGDRELVRTLRPKFLSESEYAEIEYVCGVLSGATRRLADRILAEPALRAFLEVSEGEARLFAPEPLVPDPAPFTRWDSFLGPDGPRFVELNAENPAGAGYADAISAAFEEHPLTAEIRRRTGGRFLPMREAVLHDLLLAWRAAGKTSAPRILITDYLDLPTVDEFYILRDYFRARGFRCEVEDPRRLDYVDGRLIAHGAPFDLVYRRVLVNEFLARESEVRPLFEAYRDRAIAMVNPFRCKLLHKKTLFALLTGDGPAGAEWMTAEEKRVVARHVPWTRKVRETKTEVDGRTVDLLQYLLLQRERVVLKPADDYGGRGVTLGWAVDRATFEDVLLEATKGHWVAQLRVATTDEPFPLFDRDLEDAPMTVDLDPYVHFGRVRGTLARLAAGAISNVTSGGGQVPVLVIPADGVSP
ncbi:MAG TPA: hypothetical protein VEI02_09145 [Planctomycetota bacterium]|nr:hypothetical protein [Planctomycetota bacterium]